MNEKRSPRAVKRKAPSSVQSSIKQKKVKLDDASSILSLTPSMAYGVAEEYDDDDSMSIGESERMDNVSFLNFGFLFYKHKYY